MAFFMEGKVCVKTRFLKIGDAYFNMDRIDVIRECAGEVIEVVMRDGKRYYGNKKDLLRMEIICR